MRLDGAGGAGEPNQSISKPPEVVTNFTNRVGFFDGSMIAFVDLVDERTQRELMRIFGPSQPPPKEAPPSSASRAYEVAGARRGRTGDPGS